MSFFDRLAERFELDEFNRRHKLAFVFLILGIILIIVLWIVQLQKNIVNPLYGGVNPQTLQNSGTNENAGDAALQAKDTDGDTLNDYDELNLYFTSPYLNDSDSDGTTDDQEIKNSTDPNCPTGQQCTNTPASSGGGASLTNPDLNNFLNNVVAPTTTPTVTPSVTPQTNSSSLSAEEKDALRKVLGSTNDPATLRNFLLQGGADKSYIDAISDADLQKVINELLK